MWLVGSKPTEVKMLQFQQHLVYSFARFFAQMTSCFVHYDVGGWQPCLNVVDTNCGNPRSGLGAQPSGKEAGILKMSKWSEGDRKWCSPCGLPCGSWFYVFHSSSEGTGGILAWEYSRHTSLNDGGKLRMKRSKIRRLHWGILAVCFIYFISLYCIVLHFKYLILFHFLLLYFKVRTNWSPSWSVSLAVFLPKRRSS